jgi:hypothetical protein
LAKNAIPHVCHAQHFFLKNIDDVIWPFGLDYKNPFTMVLGFSILLFTDFNVVDKSCRQVLTPVNNSQLPFKAVTSRQVQTCCKPQNTTQRKLQHFLVQTGTGESGVLMTLNHRASM